MFLVFLVLSKQPALSFLRKESEKKFKVVRQRKFNFIQRQQGLKE